MLLFGVAMKYLKNKDKAEDAVQQILLKSLTHLPQGEIQNFKGWLYILMRNHCLQTLRDKAHNTFQALSSLAAAPSSIAAIEEKELTLRQLEEAMKELTAAQRLSLELFYLKKKSYQQIMEQTGYSFMQVKSFIQNGKRNLKLILLKKMKANDE